MKEMDVPFVLILPLLDEQQGRRQHPERADFQKPVRKDGAESFAALGNDGAKVGEAVCPEDDKTTDNNDKSNNPANRLVVPSSFQLVPFLEGFALFVRCGNQNQEDAVINTKEKERPVGTMPHADEDDIDAGRKI